MRKIITIFGLLLLSYSAYPATLNIVVKNNLPKKQSIICKTNASTGSYTIAGQKSSTISLNASKFTFWIYPKTQSKQPCSFVVSLERGGILYLGTWGVMHNSYGYCINNLDCLIPEINACNAFKITETPKVVNENGQQMLRLTVAPAKS